MSDTSNLNDPTGTATVTTEAAAAPSGASWQEQDGVLRDLWMNNKTPQEISDALGRSVPAIMTRAARLGLPRRTAPGRKPGSSSTRRFRLPSENQNAPQPSRVVDSTALVSQAGSRICLMCLRKFESAGRHNRICSPCKGSSEYLQAATLPDINLPQS